MLFKNRRVAFLSIVVFCFYPFTFWYVGAFTQDIWFQSFLIIFMFYFTVYLKNFKIKNLITSALIFSITFLTKSHILIFALFIPLIIFFQMQKILNQNFYIFCYFPVFVLFVHCHMDCII